MPAVMKGKKKRMSREANLIVSAQFADVFQAYLECSDAVQAAIRDMVSVMNAPDVTDDEYDAALATIAEALFPSQHNGSLGVDLEDCPADASDEVKTVLRQMDAEQATFGERLAGLLDARGMTQGDLAAAIGVGQPAISMLMTRDCRPQRRTIEKIARALKVSSEELWPGFKEE